MNDQEKLIRRALDHAGYNGEPATTESLINCFTDYVDAGVWSDLTLDDIGELSVLDMARALINLKG